MSDISKTISDWLHEKLNSPMYIVFIFSEILWHWKYLFALFVEENIPEDISSFSYAQQFLRNQDYTFSGYFAHLEKPAELIVNVGYSIIPPVVATYLILYQLPKLHRVVHRDNLKFHFARKKEFDEQNKEYEEARTKDLREVEKTISEQKKITENIVKEKNAQTKARESLSDKELWDLDYADFKRNKLFDSFSQIIKVLYENGGDTHKWNGDDYTRIISADILALCHTKGLIGISGSGTDERIDFSEKGKYFASKYLDENQK